jgi:hypothetical protein
MIQVHRENIATVKRVAVVGSGGAGKTTFARELSRRTGLPVVHLDHLYWRPGWVETPSEEWRVVQDEGLTADKWIVAGTTRVRSTSVSQGRTRSLSLHRRNGGVSHEFSGERSPITDGPSRRRGARNELT